MHDIDLRSASVKNIFFFSNLEKKNESEKDKFNGYSKEGVWRDHFGTDKQIPLIKNNNKQISYS